MLEIFLNEFHLGNFTSVFYRGSQVFRLAQLEELRNLRWTRWSADVPPGEVIMFEAMIWGGADMVIISYESIILLIVINGIVKIISAINH